MGAEIAGAGVDGWSDAYGRQGGVEHDRVCVVQPFGQPCGRYEWMNSWWEKQVRRSASDRSADTASFDAGPWG